jgi:hypothetical protein
VRKLIQVLIPLALAATVAVHAQAPAPMKGDVPCGPPHAPPVVTSLTGVLAFVDDKPAIKADSGTMLLIFPDFFRYAYFEGYKAGVAIKAKGILIAPPIPPQDTASQSIPAVPSKFIAKELTIGAKTYIIVDGPPRHGMKGRGGPPKDKMGRDKMGSPPGESTGELMAPAGPEEAYLDIDE